MKYLVEITYQATEKRIVEADSKDEALSIAEGEFLYLAPAHGVSEKDILVMSEPEEVIG